MNEKSVGTEAINHTASPEGGKREPDAICQKGKRVAIAAGVEVDLEAKEIRFDEILESDHLVLADECEFQKYRIMIQKVAFATKLDKRPGHKGRTLAGCTAEILGYAEH